MDILFVYAVVIGVKVNICSLLKDCNSDRVIPLASKLRQFSNILPPKITSGEDWAKLYQKLIWLIVLFSFNRQCARISYMAESVAFPNTRCQERLHAHTTDTATQTRILTYTQIHRQMHSHTQTHTQTDAHKHTYFIFLGHRIKKTNSSFYSQLIYFLNRYIVVLKRCFLPMRRQDRIRNLSCKPFPKVTALSTFILFSSSPRVSSYVTVSH